MAYVTGAVVLASIIAAIVDVRTRRIPDLLTFGMMIVGVANTLFTRGPLSALIAIGTVAAVIFVGSFFYGQHWLGAGDVKMFAGISAFLPPGDLLLFFLATNVAGGALGLIAWTMNRRLGVAIATSTGMSLLPAPAEAPDVTRAFPYGAAICAGLLTVVALHIFAPGMHLSL